MSDFSLTLVLQIKTSIIINDMAKVQQKSEKISAFGGIFFVLDKFDRILSSVVVILPSKYKKIGNNLEVGTKFSTFALE